MLGRWRLLAAARICTVGETGSLADIGVIASIGPGQLVDAVLNVGVEHPNETAVLPEACEGVHHRAAESSEVSDVRLDGEADQALGETMEQPGTPPVQPTAREIE